MSDQYPPANPEDESEPNLPAEEFAAQETGDDYFPDDSMPIEDAPPDASPQSVEVVEGPFVDAALVDTTPEFSEEPVQAASVPAPSSTPVQPVEPVVPLVAPLPPPPVPRETAAEVPPCYQISPENTSGAWQSRSWSWIVILALLLFAAPILFRWFTLAGDGAAYVPPSTSAPILAMTPEPTATAWAVDTVAQSSAQDITSQPLGPVIIDYAHFNQIDARGMQPLAAALSRRGLSTRVWLTEVDPFAVSSATGFPDQSEALADQLRDASALIVVSPFFFWTPEEIAVAERFVADGGRILLISDPDIYGDSAVYMNLLAEPFGVVFNDDYLYDTVRNDANYTHFFQGQFLDEAAALDGLEIAFYGGRSISGDVIPQAVSAPTTLSSRRTGVSGFATVVIAEGRGWDDGGKVIALSDFDVLTEPNVVRHDNQQIVEFVADFLAEGERSESIADFPNWLDRDVSLMIGSEKGLNADTLLVGAQLQRRLEETGRNLSLVGAPFVATATPASTDAEASDENEPEPTTGSGAIAPGARVTATPLTSTPVDSTQLPPEETATLEATEEGGTIPSPLLGDATASPALSVDEEMGNDVILLADYDYANLNSDILAQVGITLEIELVTPTPAASSTTTVATPSLTATVSTTATITSTSVITESILPDSTPMLPTETPPADATPESPSNLLGNLGIEQVPPPGATPTPESTDDDSGNEPDDRPAPAEATLDGTSTIPLTATVTVTSAVFTPTQAPTATSTPTPIPTPIEVLWLVSDDGLRMLADQTVLVIRTTNPFSSTDEITTVATDDEANPANAVIVLGSRASGINAGVKRLLDNDFSDCIVGDEVTYCPIAPDPNSASQPRPNGGSASSATGTQSATPASSGTPSGTPPLTPSGPGTPGATPAPPSSSGSVLLVDDDSLAVDGESSEADHYLRALTAVGVSPTLWSTEGEGLPSADDLGDYTWIIWSNAGYAASEMPLDALDPLFAFINGGGRLTVSSLKPFFAMGIDSPSEIVDVAVVDDVVALSKGLYSPVNLIGERPPVAPLAEPDGEESFDVTLVRGIGSANPESPAMVSATDEGEEPELGAKLIVVGMSVGWLPTDFANTLIANMAEWMLAE